MMARRGLGFSGLGSAQGTISKFLKISTDFAMIDVVSRLIPTLPGQNPALKAVASLSLSASRLVLLKKVTKGLPFGMSALLGAVVTLSTIQLFISQIPQLLTLFGTTSAAATDSAAGAPSPFLLTP